MTVSGGCRRTDSADCGTLRYRLYDRLNPAAITFPNSPFQLSAACLPAHPGIANTRFKGTHMSGYFPLPTFLVSHSLPFE